MGLGRILFYTTYFSAKKVADTASDIAEFGKNAYAKAEELGHLVSGRLSGCDIAKKSEQNCLFIKTVLETNKSLSDILKYKFVDYYQVSDNNENIKYIGKYKYLSIKNSNNKFKKIEVYDSNNEKIGFIKVINSKNFDKDVKIYFKKSKFVIELRKDKNSHDIYSTSNNLKINKKLNFYLLEFEKNKTSKLHMTLIKKARGYVGKYVLEYEDIQNEASQVLLSIAIDMMEN